LNPSYKPAKINRAGWASKRGVTAIGIIAVFAMAMVARDHISFLSAPTRVDVESKPITFDAYAKGVTSILYDAQGEIEYTLETTEQTHFLDNTTELTDPFVRLYKDSDVRWNIIARSGRILEASEGDEIERLDLSNTVELFQIDDFGKRMTLATEFVSIFPGQETMSTKHPVALSSGGLHQDAVGMRVDFNQDTMTFLSQVKGRYEPQDN